MKANLLLSFFTLVICLLLAEILLRIIIPAELPNPHQLFCEYDPLLGWRKVPGRTARHVTAEYDITESINQQGIRGPEYSLEKNPGEYRILILGDSYAEGYTVAFQHLFSEVLQDSVNAICTDRATEVINAGTGGYSTDQELLYFEHHGKAYDPDLTVLVFCINDPWYNIRPSYWRGAKPLFIHSGDSLELTNVPVPPPGKQSVLSRLKSWSLAHSELIRRIRNAKERISYMVKDQAVPDEWTVFVKEDLPETRRAWKMTGDLIRRLKRQTASQGSELLVFYIPEKIEVYPESRDDFLESYSLNADLLDLEKPRRMLAGICDSLDIPLIDPTDTFKERAGKEPTVRFYFEKDWHWTEAGHHLVGEIMAGYLAREWKCLPGSESGMIMETGRKRPGRD